MNIPLFKPFGYIEEASAVKEVLMSGWWGMGKKVEEFEKKFAKMCGAKYAVATNSCTTALEIAVRCSDLPKTVKVPAFTFISSALAPLLAGHKVKFTDIEEETLCSKDADISVHYAGNDPKTKAPIHDMAHCGGQKHYDPISCWSFHAVKNLACGDGGMLTTNNKKIYEKAKRLRWCGIDKSTYERSKGKYHWEYDVKEVGLKAHMNDITASIGLAQLDKLLLSNSRRTVIAWLYATELADVGVVHSFPYHLYPILVNDRDKLHDYLAEKGISTSVHYKPLYYYKIFGKQKKLPVTEWVYKHILSLPIYPEMSVKDVRYIIKSIKEFNV
jgi:perosamine synthetase